MAEQVNQYLPLEEAVEAAAKQNFDRDVKVGLARQQDWKQDKSVYMEEARHLLQTTGENYIPDDPALPIICLQKD